MKRWTEAQRQAENRRWYVWVPGWTYALGPGWRGFTEDEVRAAVRKMLGRTRLPKGTDIWPA